MSRVMVHVLKDHYDNLWRLITRYEILLRHKGYSRSDLDEQRLRVFGSQACKIDFIKAKPSLNRHNKKAR